MGEGLHSFVLRILVAGDQEEKNCKAGSSQMASVPSCQLASELGWI